MPAFPSGPTWSSTRTGQSISCEKPSCLPAVSCLGLHGLVPRLTGLAPLQGICLRRGPDRETERDLVHEVSKVVHQIQHTVIHRAHQVPKEVAQGVDRPTHSNDEAHERK